MGYIGILDFKNNNSQSVLNILSDLGFPSKLVNTKEGVEEAERLVIPGVGHIEAIVNEMDYLNLRQPILNLAKSGKFILGICIGQHLLGLGSNESPQVAVQAEALLSKAPLPRCNAAPNAVQMQKHSTRRDRLE